MLPPEFRAEAVKGMRDSDKPLWRVAKDLSVSGRSCGLGADRLMSTRVNASD